MSSMRDLNLSLSCNVYFVKNLRPGDTDLLGTSTSSTVGKDVDIIRFIRLKVILRVSSCINFQHSVCGT